MRLKTLLMLGAGYLGWRAMKRQRAAQGTRAGDLVRRSPEERDAPLPGRAPPRGLSGSTERRGGIP